MIEIKLMKCAASCETIDHIDVVNLWVTALYNRDSINTVLYSNILNELNHRKNKIKEDYETNNYNCGANNILLQ